MEEYNNKKNKSLLDTETINNTSMSEGEGLGFVDSTKEFAKDIFINVPLAVKDFFNKEKQKTEAETNVSKLMQQTRERLKLTDNPFTAEENIRTIETANKNLEQIRNSPFANIITLKEEDNNKELEYLKASQYNSANNILKNGTKGIVSYRDKDNNQKQLTLTGNEFITEDMDNIYIRNNNEEQIMIPKQLTKQETLKDNYTSHELELIRKNDINYRHMTNEEWNREINEIRTNYYSLNKALTKRMQALAHSIPDKIREDIDYQDTIGIISPPS